MALLGSTAIADKILLLNSNLDSLQARFDYIQNAQSEIKVQYFSIDKDYLSFSTLAILRDAAARGVKVKILVDAMHNDILKQTMSALLLSLTPEKKSNIEIKVYNSFNLLRPLRYTKRMHDKGLIIDDKAMISGGRNIANGFFGRSGERKILPIFEDSDALILESRSIHNASEYFNDLWNSKFVSSASLGQFSASSLKRLRCPGKTDAASCERTRQRNVKLVQQEEERINEFIQAFKARQTADAYEAQDWNNLATEVGPIEFLYDDVRTQPSNLDKPEHNIASQLYNFIQQAQESVTIITPYLVITPEQESLFRQLRERNIRVNLYTNSKAANDVSAAHVGYEKTRELALRHNVNLYEYQGPDTLHAKLALIDGKTFYIGSFNWDYRSQNLNREVGLIVNLPAYRDTALRHDIDEKFGRIARNSCLVRSSTCSPVSNVQLSDLSETELNNLIHVAKKRDRANARFFRLIYPLIKKQL
ncbi:hypothetical protein A11Q_1018 [Pseudobdellovibrio exovorus JSS]|uniref:PLD phosphodiesterase domain-containing protein n=2 Tax=Pseudobdellovibrio exovorus TaxID=453816 RepID=M4VQ11_9BACT|nr:hypothetical protein A11Q_1018 [Pseudobdellovibrio exovorus JSS]